MKTNISLFAILILSISLLSFTSKNEISKCYILFNPDNLIAAEPERLPETAEKFRTIKTDNGEVTITRIDGYRILFNNDKGVPFVNLKVELSNEKSYDADQKNLLENIKYLNEHSKNMETKDLIELDFNGYKIYGLNRNTIEEGSNLGTYIMFPGNGVSIYFYFNNLKPEFRTFSSIEDYKKQRDKFLEAYTAHLKKCPN